jgi:hypothetical protein
MDPLDENVEDLQLAKSFDELLITKKVVAEELKGFYDIIPCAHMKEILMFDLPYTTEEYEEYEQRGRRYLIWSCPRPQRNMSSIAIT